MIFFFNFAFCIQKKLIIHFSYNSQAFSHTMKIKLLPLKNSLISRKPYKTCLHLLEKKFAGIRILFVWKEFLSDNFQKK